MRTAIHLIRLALILALATAGFADIITFKSGRVVNGTYLGGTARELKVQVGDEIQTFDVSQVAKIEFGNGSAAPSVDPNRPVLRRNQASDNSDDSRPTLRRDPSPSTSASSDDSRPTLRRDPSASTTSASTSDDSRPTLRRDPTPAYSDDSASASRRGGDAPTILRPDASEPSAASTAASVAQHAPVEIPAGTNLVVRMIDGVDSERDKVGATFRASMDQPITVAGDVVISRGADVIVKLVDDKEAGKLSGRAELTLSLAQVKVDGRMVDINTQSITKDSDARGKSTAKKAGVGAVAGAVLGGVLGGGKGAAVGAAAGAGAGAGVEAMSSGPHVKVPSETRLTFILDNPITL